MVFVGAAIMPHGTLPFDGNKESESAECRQRYNKLQPEMAEKFKNLYEGMCKTAQFIASLDPDIIILHSPHGIVLENSVGIYINPTAEGDATWNECWSEFKVCLQLDLPKSEELLKHLQSDNVQAEGICCFSRFAAPLRWGEVVPAWYLEKYLKKDVHYILMSQSRQKLPVDSISESRLHVGRSLYKFISSLPERVAVVISGDLSHVYHSDYPDPLYQPAKGWKLHSNHATACAMEKAFIGWTKAIKDLKFFDEGNELTEAEEFWSADDALLWLQKAADLQPAGYSCGLVGFIMLHALLQSQGQSEVKVKANVVACEAPTYYGMMAATFSIV